MLIACVYSVAVLHNLNEQSIMGTIFPTIISSCGLMFIVHHILTDDYTFRFRSYDQFLLSTQTQRARSRAIKVERLTFI